MPTYKIRGIDVDFPFEAYDCQLIYMEKVIRSLQNRCNALLESPTGTGKTLCLLCATLAWRKSLGGFSTGKIERNGQVAGSKPDNDQDEVPESAKVPTIVYTSRTHSQLRQVVQELRRSSYRPKMVVLGSREQLCIHEEVSQLRGKAQTNACQYVSRKKTKHHCGHFSRTNDYVKNNPHLGDEPIDIEDLVNVGRKFGPCPYYLSRELHKVVDIVFAPYNYLIDRGNRKSLNIDWETSILIFDEAHNLESICADAASFDLPSWLLTACISEAKSCIDLSLVRREKLNDQSQNPDNFSILRALLLKLEKRIAEVPIESKESGFTKPGPYIYDLLSDLNITHDTAHKLIGTIEQAAELLEEDKQQKATETVCRLESIKDMLRIIFRDKDKSHANFYRVHIREHETNATDVLKGKLSRTLSWWCFNPGIVMEELARLGVSSIILTSGTLSPMNSFAQELKLDFPVRLENPHVISSNQIWVGVVQAGPLGRSFNSSYRNRDSVEYKQELGNAIVNLARIVPDGLLVFFPSYYLMDQCIGCWKNMNTTNSTTIWERICKHKKPVVEPKQASLFSLAIEDYMAKLKDSSSSGAIFFAVCRGKVSEGLDFADHAGRAVIVIGIPFPMRTDPKVRLKREYLDQQVFSRKDGSNILSGENWYSQQASRAVNQAVGRVIRHRHDYGAIIFFDERFAHPNQQSQISLWIRPHIKCHSKFGDVIFTLSRFFRDGQFHAPNENLLKSKDGATLAENVREAETSQSVDKFFLDSFLSVKTEKNRDSSAKSLSSLLESKKEMNDGQLGEVLLNMESSVKSLSSLIENKKGKNACQLGEVLPANRSSLHSFKENPNLRLNHSSGLISNEKKILVSERKYMLHKNPEIIDLTYETSSRKNTQGELLIPCAMKKHKLDNDTARFIESSRTLSSIATRQNNEVCTSMSCNDRGNTADLTQQHKGSQSTATDCGDKESRGSAFLIQVKEKLSTAEYKEFIGFMKALKSEAMKIGHVLQSIVKLFSAPDRFPLLRRFKDYVPAKYRPLYEHYLEANDEPHDDQT